MKDDIRIAIIKRTDAVRRPFDNVEFLDSPDLQARNPARPLPRPFGVACMFTNAFFKLWSQFVQCA
jgi:hypothetical protein